MTTNKPLPPMVNVGVMTKKQVADIVKQFPQNQIAITRFDIIIKVSSIAGTEVLSAAFLGRGKWHVRAREGLVSPTV